MLFKVLSFIRLDESTRTVIQRLIVSSKHRVQHFLILN